MSSLCESYQLANALGSYSSFCRRWFVKEARKEETVRKHLLEISTLDERLIRKSSPLAFITEGVEYFRTDRGLEFIDATALPVDPVEALIEEHGREESVDLVFLHLETARYAEDEEVRSIVKVHLADSNGDLEWSAVVEPYGCCDPDKVIQTGFIQLDTGWKLMGKKDYACLPLREALMELISHLRKRRLAKVTEGTVMVSLNWDENFDPFFRALKFMTLQGRFLSEVRVINRSLFGAMSNLLPPTIGEHLLRRLLLHCEEEKGQDLHEPGGHLPLQQDAWQTPHRPRSQPRPEPRERLPDDEGHHRPPQP